MIGGERWNRLRKWIVENWILCVFFAVIILGVLGLGISAAVIHANGNTYPGGECGVFPSGMSKFDAEYSLFSVWNYEYEFQNADAEFPGDEGDSRFEMNCPTVNADTVVYVGGKMVGRSDGEMFGNMDVLDCKGNVLYIIHVGDLESRAINGLTFSSELWITDAANENVLGFAEGDSFWDQEIIMKDAVSNRVVATAKLPVALLVESWTFQRLDASSPVSDPLLLMVLAGRVSFRGKEDGCNSYFWNVATVFLALGIFIALAIILYIVFWIKKRQDNNRRGNDAGDKDTQMTNIY